MKRSTVTCWLAAVGAVTVLTGTAGAAEPAAKRILCFGDSNTEALNVQPNQAWPEVLEQIMPGVVTLNAGADSRTVGQEEGQRNGLESIEPALQAAGVADEVIVMLGTNDMKGSLWQAGGGANGVAKRLVDLVGKIKAYRSDGRPAPRITLVAPPPVHPGKLAERFRTPEMFLGANSRVRALIVRYQAIALAHNLRFVNLPVAIANEIEDIVTEDGVHFNAQGHRRIAETIAGVIGDSRPPAPPANVTAINYALLDLDGTTAHVTTRVEWEKSPSEDVIGYRIHLGADGPLIAVTGRTIVALPGNFQGLVIVARDAAGNDSPPAAQPETEEIRTGAP